MHQQLILNPGESITIELPSGRKINIEATGDYSEIVIGKYILFSENNKGITYPKHLMGEIK